VPKTRQSAHVYELAKRGAEARITELLNEVRQLTSLFPDLRKSVDRDELPIPFILKRGADQSAGRRSGQRGWTPAQRKAAAARMRAYWAKRKAGKKS
jgi:hypothetical protein